MGNHNRLLASWILSAWKNWLIGNIRKTTNLLVGVLTSHCRFGKHFTAMKIEENTAYPKCEEADEIDFQLLAQCPARSRMRYASFGATELNAQDINDMNES